MIVGSGASDQAHNKQSSTTGGRSKSTVSPGVHSRDTNQKHLIENNYNNNKSKGPKVIAGDSGNVIFGDRSALLKDIKNKNESIGRKKRVAPRPPVLVDIDVGFDEQNVSEEATYSEERGSLEKRQEKPERPPPPNVATNLMLNAQMGKSRQHGASPRDQTINTNDKINGINKYHHQPGSKPTTISKVEPKRVQSKSSTLTPENGHCEPDGFLSSYNGSSSSNKAGRSPTVGQNPLLRSNNTGIVSEPHHHNHPVLDNSSSSGIGSSISDSSASDPGSFKTKLVIAARRGLSPLIVPATHESGATDYPSSADDLDDSDSEFSDEMTMDFDEEEEQVEKRRMKLYEEYQGEDFAKYLKDEDEDVPKNKNNRKKKRKLKKRDKNEKINDNTEKSVAPTISPTSTYSASSGENGGKRSLKLKLGQMFAFPGADGKQKSGHISPGGIHAFSYADSKIGTMTSEKDFDDNVYSTSRRKSSGSGSAMFHETSDAQDLERTSSQRWWRKDMLSAKTLDSNSDIMLKVKRHDSHSDIDLTSSLSADSINPAIHNGFGESHGGGGYKTDDEDKMNDFESYRKNNLYDTKPRKPSGGSKSKTSLLRKISRSFKKSHVKEVSDNTVDNPLTMSLPSDKEGVYL